MTLPTDIFTYVRWSGIATIATLIVTIIAFIAKWGFRFRLVGATSFMGVLTIGIFALGLSFFPHETIPGAVRYSLVYDNGSNLAVVSVPQNIDRTAIEPTLRQAASDLYSYGRTGTKGNDRFIIRLRTVLHPNDRTSQPLFLGEARRPISNRQDKNIAIEVFEKNLQQLPTRSVTIIN
jgi:hypothetical protein